MLLKDALMKHAPKLREDAGPSRKRLDDLRKDDRDIVFAPVVITKLDQLLTCHLKISTKSADR
jgi:hypothetical protein